MCNHCGQRNHKDNRFCSRCGSALSESAVILDEIEYVKRHPREQDDEPEAHEYKSYPVLNFVAIILKIGGCLMLAASLVLFVISITRIFGLGSTTVMTHDSVKIIGWETSSWQVLIFFISSLFSFFIGLLLVFYGEIIELFMDLQENADRQSILLSLLYYREKGKTK